MHSPPPKHFRCTVCARKRVPIEWTEVEAGQYLGRSFCVCGAVEAHICGDPDFVDEAQRAFAAEFASAN